MLACIISDGNKMNKQAYGSAFSWIAFERNTKPKHLCDIECIYIENSQDKYNKLFIKISYLRWVLIL